jgi:hypothetical protein
MAVVYEQMSRTFTLADSQTLDDLQVFLARAARIEEGSVRLIAGSGILAVYVAVFYPVGLLDESPTILGLRTTAIAPDADGTADEFDVVVPLRSLLTRLETAQGIRAADTSITGPVVITLPMEVNTVVWAAISPPRGGWHGLHPVPAESLVGVADAGIAEIRDAVPAGTGEQLVHRARAEVWGRAIDGFEHIPAGAAFAGHTLGFLAPPEPVRVYETGPWTRLSSERGHVLVRRRAWTLQA